MIKEIKDLLQTTITARVPGVTIVRSIAEESRVIMARKWPLVSLITNPGRFDDREAKTIRYPDSEAGVWKERYVRGRRIVPILLRCFGRGENDADALLSRILPAIPRKWEYDGFEGLVVIEAEEHSDFTDSVNQLYLSVAEIQFSVPVALDETAVPTFRAIEAEPELNEPQ